MCVAIGVDSFESVVEHTMQSADTALGSSVGATKAMPPAKTIVVPEIMR